MTRCPSCRATVTRNPAAPSKVYPFCSERCHLVDLGRWFGEEYRLAGTPTAAAAEAAAAVLDQHDKDERP